ncbi:MAG: NADH-quinone oxidoreductase subunit NuoE [Bacteroidota bacterium]|nr:NADH-quinone oxidoreductase subunit NuoE [Bacteroidota bacterium]
MRIQRISKQPNSDSTDGIDISLMNPLIEKYKNKKGNMIPLLQGIQDLYRFLPEEAFHKINKEVGLELSDMYGVATFYSQFRLTPVGKHIVKVCHGTACHVQNAGAITDALQDTLKIKDGETTEDGMFTLESVACLGCCSLAPAMMVDEETYGKLNRKAAQKVIKEIKIKEKE